MGRVSKVSQPDRATKRLRASQVAQNAHHANDDGPTCHFQDKASAGQADSNKISTPRNPMATTRNMLDYMAKKSHPPDGVVMRPRANPKRAGCRSPAPTAACTLRCAVAAKCRSATGCVLRPGRTGIDQQGHAIGSRVTHPWDDSTSNSVKASSSSPKGQGW